MLTALVIEAQANNRNLAIAAANVDRAAALAQPDNLSLWRNLEEVSMASSGYESARLNDACLALAATYSADTDRYRAALAAQEEDLAAFIARVRSAAEQPDPTRALLAPH